MSKRAAELYIKDIKDAIRKIEKYTRGVSRENFMVDEQLIDAVVRNLSIIGEAVVNIPKEIKTKNQDVAWPEITGMRNKVIHEYFGVDKGILWETIKNNLPEFKKQIRKMMAKF